VGDALGVPLAWRVGGALNIASLLGFVAVVMWALTRTGRKGGE
jgi:hypothetical protein